MQAIFFLIYIGFGIALTEQTDVCSQVHVMSQYCTSQGVVANGTGDLVTRQELDVLLETRLTEIEERLRLNLESPPPVNYTLVEEIIALRFLGVEERIIQQLGEPPKVNYTAIEISINERFKSLEAMVNGDGGTSESIVDYNFIQTKVDEKFVGIRAYVDEKFDRLLNDSLEYQNAVDEMNRRTNATDCLEIRLETAKICNATGGLFDIYRGQKRYEVFCDTYTDGGGWTVFQRRMDGSVNFNRNWTEYVEGFGDRDKEFWLGLKNIHDLLSAGTHEMRIDILDSYGRIRFARYGVFYLGGKSTNYNLILQSYTGDATNYLTSGARFYAVGNDTRYNCAMKHLGGWWYSESSNCGNSALNGAYGTNELEWNGISSSITKIVKTEMKFRKLVAD